MKKKKLNKKKVALAGGILLLTICLIIYLTMSLIGLLFGGSKETKKTSATTQTEEKKEEEYIDPNKEVKFTISFAGDCTFGNYAGMSYSRSFNQVYKQQNEDPTYFLKNVKPIFEKDDLTVVNLEGPITTATKHYNKKFAFSGIPEYTKILTSSSVEVCSLANNHSEDYYKQGMDDTKKYLSDAKVGFFGYETSYTTKIKGIKCGFLGYRSITPMTKDSDKKMVKEAIRKLKEDEGCKLVFVYFHWGQELAYKASNAQRTVAHYTIDYGADAVIGSHPHVIEGEETYKDKPIIYSLGNFSFGGNKNCRDKDSMIYQLTYEFKGAKEQKRTVNIIPVCISSVKGRNNYQPTPYDEENSKRVLEKIKKYSF